MSRDICETWEPGDMADFRLCFDTQPVRVTVIEGLPNGCVRVKVVTRVSRNVGLRRHYDCYPKHLWEVR